MEGTSGCHLSSVCGLISGPSCLIAMALKNSKTGSLPVSEIYSFMKEHFPYFKVRALTQGGGCWVPPPTPPGIVGAQRFLCIPHPTVLSCPVGRTGVGMAMQMPFAKRTGHLD